MNVFELYAKLGLDSSAFEAGLASARNAGSAFGNGLASAARVGLQAVTLATTAVAGMGATAVQTGQNFDKSMSQVAATMGTTVDQIENLRDFAQEMGRTTAFSATQAADALNYMALAGYKDYEAIEMLPNVLNLAAAGNMDLARASDMVTDTQTAFGLELSNVSQLIDEMAKAASTGNTSVEQLGDAFLTVGGLAQDLNGGFVYLNDGTEVAVSGIQELEIALTAMANAGIKGSEACTHMRNMLLKLSSPTSDGTKALEAMGVVVFDAEGQMRSLADIFVDLGNAMGTMTQEQKLQTISDLFNARDIASAEALLQAVEKDWDKIGASILDAEGAANAMANTQLDNLAGDVTLFKSALEGAQIAISDVLTPSLRDFVKFGTDGLSRLTSAFQTGGLSGAMGVFGDLLSEGLNMMVQKLPTFVDGGIQLLEALGQGIIDNLPMFTAIATEIISRLGSALTENLPAMIQAGSDILSGLLNAIIDNLDTITPLITEFIVGFVQIMANNADEMIEVAIAIASAIGEGLIQAAPIIAKVAPEVIGALTSAIVKNPAALIALGPGIIGKIATGIKLAKPLISAIGKLIPSGLGSSIMSGLSSVGTAISGFFSNLISGIGTFLTSAVGTALTTIASSIVAFFAGAEIGKHIGSAIFPDDSELYESYSGIMGTLNMLKDFVIAIKDELIFEWEAFVENVTVIATATWDAIVAIYSGIGNWFREKFDQAKALIFAVWDSVVAYFQSIWNGIVGVFIIVAEWFYERFNEAKNNVETAWSVVTDFFSTIWEGIKAVFELAGDWFKEIFQSAYDAVTGVWDTITEFFSGVWEDIKSAFKLSDAYTWGKDLLSNFSKGIKDNMVSVVSAVTGVSGTVSDYLHFSEPDKGPLSNFHTFAPDMIDLFTSGIYAGEDKVEDALTDAFAMPNMGDVESINANVSTVPAVAGVGAMDINNITSIISDALRGIMVNVSIGDENLDNIISTSIQRTNYRSGGR